MPDPNPLPDPRTLLRRIVAAWDALQQARIEHGDAAGFVAPAEQALRDAVEEARRLANAAAPWRRETSRAKRRRA